MSISVVPFCRRDTKLETPQMSPIAETVAGIASAPADDELSGAPATFS
jgi:hypothetical protein